MARSIEELVNKTSRLMNEVKDPNFDRFTNELRENGNMKYLDERKEEKGSNKKIELDSQHQAPIKETCLPPRQNKLPDKIFQSMIENPINIPGDMSSNDKSVLEGIDFSKINGLKKTEPIQKISQITKEPIINESKQVIDYSLLKMIINEAVKKNISALGKKLITEGKETNNSTNITTLRIGDKFNFLTQTGDLFEAKLKFIKNIHDK